MTELTTAKLREILECAKNCRTDKRCAQCGRVMSVYQTRHFRGGSLCRGIIEPIERTEVESVELIALIEEVLRARGEKP